jgi:uncharacterized iron-regulated membrane protein
MVLQQPIGASPPSDQTLASLWRTHARQLDSRAMVECVGIGLVGTAVPLVLGRAMLVACMSFTVFAFGAYAAIVQPSFGGRWLSPRTQRVGAAFIASGAAVAGLVAGLLVLAIVFGGSIEVMRR